MLLRRNVLLVASLWSFTDALEAGPGNLKLRAAQDPSLGSYENSTALRTSSALTNTSSASNATVLPGSTTLSLPASSVQEPRPDGSSESSVRTPSAIYGASEPLTAQSSQISTVESQTLSVISSSAGYQSASLSMTDSTLLTNSSNTAAASSTSSIGLTSDSSSAPDTSGATSRPLYVPTVNSSSALLTTSTSVSTASSTTGPTPSSNFYSSPVSYRPIRTGDSTLRTPVQLSTGPVTVPLQQANPLSHPTSISSTRTISLVNQSSCGGCTISPVGATFAWWYPSSVIYGFSSLTSIFGTDDAFQGIEVVPATTSFDLESALTQHTYLMSTSFDLEHNTSSVDFISMTLDPPVAAITSEVYVTAVRPLPTSTLIPADEIVSAYIDPAPVASVAIPYAANKTIFSAPSGTPYLYIPAYALLSAASVADGSCVVQSSTYSIPEPYYGVYNSSSDPSNKTTISESSLPADFLSVVPPSHAQCKPVLIAEVEMLVIITLIYDTEFSAFLAHTESSITDSPDVSTTTGNELVTSTITSSDEAVVVICNGRLCFPVINIAHTEAAVPGPLDGPEPVTRVIVPVTTSTAKNGRTQTIFGQAPASGGTGSGSDSGGSGSSGSGSSGSGSSGSGSSGSGSSGSGSSGSGSKGGSPSNGDGSSGSGSSGTGSTGKGSPQGELSSGTGAGSSEGDSSGESGSSSGTDHGGGSDNAGGSLVPLVAHVGSTTPVTFFAPASDSITRATITFEGQTLVASAEPVSGGSGSLDSGSNSGVVNGLTAVIATMAAGSGGNVLGKTGFAPDSDHDTSPDSPTLTIGNQVFTANAAGQFNLGPGETLTQGGTVNLHGTRVVLPADNSIAVVNGVTQTIRPVGQTPPPVLTIGTKTFAGNAATQYFLGSGETLTAGGTVDYDGTRVSLAPSASFMVVNGETMTLNAPEITPAPTLVVDGTTYAANAGSTYSIDGQKLTPGGKITVKGTTISLDSDADHLVVGGATLTRPPMMLPSYPALVVGGETIQPEAEPGHAGLSDYVIDGKTLRPGGSALTISGTTISLLPSGRGVVMNGATTTFSSTIGPITSPPVLTIDGHTYSALPGGGTTYVIDGHTLTPGGVITVDGERISLAASATLLVVDGKTITLFPATGTTTISTTIVPGAQVSGSSGIKSTGQADGDPSLQGAASSLVSSQGISAVPRAIAILLVGAAIQWWM